MKITRAVTETFICNARTIADHRQGKVSSSPLDPVVPSFRALCGRLKFTVRRDKLNKDCLSAQVAADAAAGWGGYDRAETFNTPAVESPNPDTQPPNPNPQTFRVES